MRGAMGALQRSCSFAGSLDDGAAEDPCAADLGAEELTFCRAFVGGLSGHAQHLGGLGEVDEVRNLRVANWVHASTVANRLTYVNRLGHLIRSAISMSSCSDRLTIINHVTTIEV